LKTGSNFSDNSNSIGQNGVGASITNIFSKIFNVETGNGEYKTQLFCKNNLSEYDYKINKNSKQYTKIEYLPDYKRFGLKELDETHFNLLLKCVMDYAICFPDIKFIFNGKTVDSNFKKYCEYYSDDNIISSNENVDICIFSGDYEPVSFVNGINTIRGGNHVDFIINKLTYSLKELIVKKYKDIKPSDIKNKLNFIINYRNFKAPRFDSQTKEYLINVNKEFSHLLDDIDFDKLAHKIYKNESIMFPILETYKIKEELKKREKIKNTEKKIKKKNILKLIEANERDRSKCVLYITEGESALSRFIEVREKHQAGYPLRGKVISPQDTPLDKLIKNQEISDILSTTGLSLTDSNIENLRYCKIVIMTDQDPDGGAIMATLVNFFYTFWPDLIKQNKLF
jgi:DNA gyrase/topoisomerase IV subunit B